MPVKFSIIIPFYNSSNFLKKSVLSIIKQKRKNIEIILIDDYSNDKSKKIYQALKKKYAFIRIIKNKKNCGVGKSRNKGILKSTGKYLVFLDSDDYLFPKSLKKLEDLIKKSSHPDMVVLKHKKSTYPITNEKLINDVDFNIKSPEKFISYLNKTEVPFADCWFICVKKDLLFKNKIYFPNTRFGESEYFVSKIICSMKSYACLDQSFYFKNDRLDSLNSSDDYDATVSVLENLIQFCEFLKQKNLSPIKKKFVTKYIENGFGLLSTLLILRKRSDLIKISKYLQKNKKVIKRIKIPKKKYNIFLLLNKYGALKGLRMLIKNIYKEKNQQISKIKNSRNIYIYCKSKYAAATLLIMKKNKLKIKGVIDDSYIFRKERFLGHQVMNSKVFLKQAICNLTNTSVIINHQKISISKKIKEFLIKKGLKKRQIVSIKY